MTLEIAPKLFAAFEAIAKEDLFIETLVTRKRDGLDFHDCHVGGIRTALLNAYRLGLADGQKKTARRVANAAGRPS